MLFVSHGEPACEDDSGWSITCGQAGHPTSELMLVAMEEAVEHTGAVSEMLLLAEGYCAERADALQDWVVEQL